MDNILQEYLKAEIVNAVEGIRQSMAENKPVSQVKAKIEKLSDKITDKEFIYVSAGILDWATERLEEMIKEVTRYESDRQSVALIPKTKKTKPKVEKPKKSSEQLGESVVTDTQIVPKLSDEGQVTDVRKETPKVRKPKVKVIDEPEETQSSLQRYQDSYELKQNVERYIQNMNDMMNSGQSYKAVEKELWNFAEFIKNNIIKYPKDSELRKWTQKKFNDLQDRFKEYRSSMKGQTSKIVQDVPTDMRIAYKDIAEDSEFTKAIEEGIQELSIKPKIPKTPTVPTTPKTKRVTEGKDAFKEQLSQRIRDLSDLMDQNGPKESVKEELESIGEVVNQNKETIANYRMKTWVETELKKLRSKFREYSANYQKRTETSMIPKPPEKKSLTERKSSFEEPSVDPQKLISFLEEPKTRESKTSVQSIKDSNDLMKQIEKKLQIVINMIKRNESVGDVKREWAALEKWLTVPENAEIIDKDLGLRQWLEKEMRAPRALYYMHVTPDVPPAPFQPMHDLYDLMEPMKSEPDENKKARMVRKWTSKFPEWPYGGQDKQAIKGAPHWFHLYRYPHQWGEDRMNFDAVKQDWSQHMPTDFPREENYKLSNVRKLGTVLGKGSFGSVIDVAATEERIDENGRVVKKPLKLACKIIKPPPAITETEMSKVLQELKYCIEFRHENIVRGYGVIEIPDRKTGFPYANILLLMEICDTCVIHLRKYQGWTMALVKVWIRQALKGLIYLHDTLKLAHGDLHDGNILVKYGSGISKNDSLNRIVPNSTFKLGDFGFTIDRYAKITKAFGKQDNRAPEMVNLTANDLAICDIYFFGKTITQFLDAVKSQIKIDEGCQKFLDKLLKDDPRDRPTAKEALDDPWLKE